MFRVAAQRLTGRRVGARWTLQLALLLAAFWLILSGHYTALLLALGAVSIGVVCWVSARAGADTAERYSLRLVALLPAYLAWLGKEVLTSTLAVVRRIWAPRLDLEPLTVDAPTSDVSVLTQVIYANSITLTPGTLSLALHAKSIDVHALGPGDVEQLGKGEMLRRVRQLEDKK